MDRTGNTESSLMASSPIKGENSIKAVFEPEDGILKLDKKTGMLYIAATVDRTGSTESSLIASSPIKGENLIKVVMESLQTASKYS